MRQAFQRLQQQRAPHPDDIDGQARLPVQGALASLLKLPKSDGRGQPVLLYGCFVRRVPTLRRSLPASCSLTSVHRRLNTSFPTISPMPIHWSRDSSDGLATIFPWGFRFRLRLLRCPSDRAPCSAAPRQYLANRHWRFFRTCEPNGRRISSPLATTSKQLRAKSATPTQRRCGPCCGAGSAAGCGNYAPKRGSVLRTDCVFRERRLKRRAVSGGKAMVRQ